MTIQPWIKDGKLVVDATGAPILCERCPCVEDCEQSVKNAIWERQQVWCYTPGIYIDRNAEYTLYELVMQANKIGPSSASYNTVWISEEPFDPTASRTTDPELWNGERLFGITGVINGQITTDTCEDLLAALSRFRYSLLDSSYFAVRIADSVGYRFEGIGEDATVKQDAVDAAEAAFASAANITGNVCLVHNNFGVAPYANYRCFAVSRIPGIVPDNITTEIGCIAYLHVFAEEPTAGIVHVFDDQGYAVTEDAYTLTNSASIEAGEEIRLNAFPGTPIFPEVWADDVVGVDEIVGWKGLVSGVIEWAFEY